jgi:lysophospholipase L1-like esterase
MRTRLLLPLLLAIAAAVTCQAADPNSENPAIEPVPRDAGWLKRHESFVARAKKGNARILFMGDSITDGWRDQPLWKTKYVPMKAVDFGIGGDCTQHVLWRLQNGECKGIKPKLVVLMIGTNNMGGNSESQIVEGITAIVKEFRTRLPGSRILLLAIFPRGEKADDPLRKKVNDVNREIAKLDDGKWVKYLDINGKFLDADGTLPRDIMPDLVHPNAKGYQIWADAIEPTLQELLK